MPVVPKIVLSKEEAEMARTLWPKLPPEQAYRTYARNKNLLVAEDRIAQRPGANGPRDGRDGR